VTGEAELESLPISALQHFVYCPRQFALIHVERLWADDARTVAGTAMHRRVDVPRSAARAGVRAITHLSVASESLGIHGVADLVEIESTPGGDRVTPVEYKRGRPKRHRADAIQLCAQALCLEEMLGCTVELAAIYYGDIRHRIEVTVDAALREFTVRTIAAARRVLAAGESPRMSYRSTRCDGCSLLELCAPRVTGSRRDVAAWVQAQLEQAP
jgi:CRISPR-associated exonuclease Cas4